MRRLLLAGAAALAIHVAFFGFGHKLIKEKLPLVPEPRTVTLALTTIQPPKKKAIGKTRRVPEKKAVSFSRKEREKPTASPLLLKDSQPSSEKVLEAPEKPVVLAKKLDDPLERPHEPPRLPDNTWRKPDKPPAKPVQPRKKPALKKRQKKTPQKPVKPPEKTVASVKKPAHLPMKKQKQPDAVEKEAIRDIPHKAHAAKRIPGSRKKKEGRVEASFDLQPGDSEALLEKESREESSQTASVRDLHAVRKAVPAYRKNPRPRYPKIAKRRGYQGTVVLEVLVAKTGKVDDLRVSASSGYKVLDRAAVKTVKKWLFEPGMKGNEKVDMWVRVPVCFRLE